MNAKLTAPRRRFSQALAIDRAVFFALLGKIWSLPAGLVTTLLIASVFSPEMQGYYYTFNSVLAFQIFAELGLGSVVTYYASHEWAKLEIDGKGRLSGDPDSRSRLSSLARFALRWYAVAAIFLTASLAVGGYFFFASGRAQFPWWAPWLTLCVITGLTLCMVPLWALLEGCNQVGNVYLYRFVQVCASAVAAWTAIYAGAGLWTASISGLASLIVTGALIGRRYGRFVADILGEQQGARLKWRDDILPMQWRIAVSWISGYFVFSLFTPVLFHYHGPGIAGRMGMTWAFVSALVAVASAWVLPKAPQFGILIAQQRYAELDRLFWRITAIVCGVTAAGALGIWTVVFMLNEFHHPFAERLLPPSSTGYLLLATVIMSASLPMSVYLRAHKKEPLLALSVVSGILTGIAVVVLGKRYSAEGMAIGYLTVTAMVTPFVAVLWHRLRTEWHTAAPLQKHPV